MDGQRASELSSEQIALPVARIDAIDEASALLFREYLSGNGCQVFVNTGPAENVMYRLVLGDGDFVKSIAQTRRISAQKLLVIAWDSDPSEFDGLFPDQTKIITIDAKPFAQQDVVEYFHFFFTSPRLQFDRRSNPKPKARPLVNEPIVKPAPPEQKPTAREPEADIPAKITVRRFFQDREEMQPPIKDTGDTKRIADTIRSVFQSSPEKKRQKPPRVEGGGRRTRIAWVIVLGIVAVFLPLYWYLISLATGAIALRSGIRCIRRADVACARAWGNTATFWIARADETLAVIRGPLGLIAGDSGILRQDRIMTLMHSSSELLLDASNMIDVAGDFAKAVLSPATDQTSQTPAIAVDRLKNEVFGIRTNLDTIYVNLSELIAQPGFPLNLKVIYPRLTGLLTEINDIRSMVSYLDRFLVLYPKLGGFRGKTPYLVLLQNSAELRPTGGFIGSLVHMSAEDGRIAEMNVEDVYAADGQLKGHVDPPKPVRDLLTQEHWYLRDSNWNPDFPDSAQRALWFYEKEMGEKPVGVIGVTSNLVTDILKATGPVDIPDFNDRISAENFLAKSTSYAQDGFFPGSTQKRDFLGSLATAIIDRLTSGKSVSPVALVRAMIDGLKSRDIQLYISDPETESAIERFGWSGSFPERTACDSDSPTEPCTFSYVSEIEANVGVNKVNPYITRKRNREVSVAEDGSVSETVTRTIRNTASGDPSKFYYRTYMRILIPTGVQVTSLTINGIPVPSRDAKAKTVTLPYGELDGSIPGITSVGLAFEVMPAEEKTVSISYKRPLKPLGAGGMRLELFEQKQAGVAEVPGTVTVRYPALWKVIAEAADGAPSVAKQGTVEYNSSLSTDEYVRLSFKKIL